jgi:hypothetical protein
MGIAARLLWPLLILLTGNVMGADPTYRLKGGGTVTVDPDTNRATVTRGGVSTPLWDGTHRLDDDSVLIINQGMTVPDEKILGTREPPLPEAETWEGVPIVGYSPCERLVWRVCGIEDQCAETEACNLARQLLGMEEQERTAAESPGRMTYSSGQCLSAGKDFANFPGCRQQADE